MALVYDKYLLHPSGNIKLHQGGFLLLHTQHDDSLGLIKVIHFSDGEMTSWTFEDKELS